MMHWKSIRRLSTRTQMKLRTTQTRPPCISRWRTTRTALSGATMVSKPSKVKATITSSLQKHWPGRLMRKCSWKCMMRVFQLISRHYWKTKATWSRWPSRRLRRWSRRLRLRRTLIQRRQRSIDRRVTSCLRRAISRVLSKNMMKVCVAIQTLSQFTRTDAPPTSSSWSWKRRWRMQRSVSRSTRSLLRPTWGRVIATISWRSTIRPWSHTTTASRSSPIMPKSNKQSRRPWWPFRWVRRLAVIMTTSALRMQWKTRRYKLSWWTQWSSLFCRECQRILRLPKK